MFDTDVVRTKKPQVLVACEYSGTVRAAFEKQGCIAVSCDILDTELPGLHHKGDVLEFIQNQTEYEFDLMIAHPPCTHLATSGARWFKDKVQEQQEALEFVQKLMQAPYPSICIENPLSVISTRIRKPDQKVQPWWFGENMQKTTCLWLKNLPLLQATNIVDKGEFYTNAQGKKMPAWYNLPDSKDRAKKRSKTFQGMADAMAEQWTKYLIETKGLS